MLFAFTEAVHKFRFYYFRYSYRKVIVYNNNVTPLFVALPSAVELSAIGV